MFEVAGNISCQNSPYQIHVTWSTWNFFEFSMILSAITGTLEKCATMPRLFFFFRKLSRGILARRFPHHPSKKGTRRTTCHHFERAFGDMAEPLTSRKMVSPSPPKRFCMSHRRLSRFRAPRGPKGMTHSRLVLAVSARTRECVCSDPCHSIEERKAPNALNRLLPRPKRRHGGGDASSDSRVRKGTP